MAKQSMKSRLAESRGMERYEMRSKGELGKTYVSAEVKPFDFKGKVQECPYESLGTNSKAFNYEW